MNENDDIESIEIPVENEIRDKRVKMVSQILKVEKDNMNKTNKDSDAEMARKIAGIIERLS